MAVATAMVTLAACGTKPEAKAPDGGSAGMMAGAPMTMQGMEMIPAMSAHLDSLGAATPAQLSGMMASHQAIASQLMGAMTVDMQGRNLHADAAWTALSDSVREDLTALPSLSGGRMQSRLQDHIARMRRMMVMHQGMMRMP